ncbi:hypothetical protein C8J56DRAFT_903311 [Mycena floridula]|nr:hypothetical protein C8J56DRAFT_903311 [Mycena floridula]
MTQPGRVGNVKAKNKFRFTRPSVEVSTRVLVTRLSPREKEKFDEGSREMLNVHSDCPGAVELAPVDKSFIFCSNSGTNQNGKNPGSELQTGRPQLLISKFAKKSSSRMCHPDESDAISGVGGNGHGFFKESTEECEENRRKLKSRGKSPEESAKRLLSVRMHLVPQSKHPGEEKNGEDNIAGGQKGKKHEA